MLALIVTVLTLSAMSAFAEGALSDEDRLPMQWGAIDRPNFTLPRRWALAFTPLLALFLLSAVLLLGGDEATGDAWGIGLTLIGIHSFYLAIVRRTVSRR